MNTFQRNAAVFAALLLPLLHGCSDSKGEREAAVETDAREAAGAAPEPVVPPAQPDPATVTPEPVALPGAFAELKPLNDSGVSGQLELTQNAELLTISGRITGLTPGEHGFHVHAGENCDTPGTHFAPFEQPHGDPATDQHHMGDLGNIIAGSDGTANLSLTTSELKLDGEHALVGHVFIVHAQRDDLSSQPSGNAGDPVACGPILKTRAPGQTPIGSTDAPAAGMGDAVSGAEAAARQRQAAPTDEPG